MAERGHVTNIDINFMSSWFDTDAQVLQCVAVCCSVLQYVAVCCSVLQCVAVCCSVLQCVAVCCSVLHSVVEYLLQINIDINFMSA